MTRHKRRVKPGSSKAAAEHRRALFIEAYIRNGGNGKQAAIEAGFARKSAESKASQLLREVKVFEQMTERHAQVLAQAQQKTQVTTDEILESMARDVRFDPAKLFNDDGSMKSIAQMDEDTRLALRGIEFDEIALGEGENRKVIGRTAKVKFPEKTAAREQGFKHFGLFKKHQEQAGRASGAAAGDAAGRAVAEALDFDAIEARVVAKLKARSKGSRLAERR